MADPLDTVFAALADPTRRAIMAMLLEDDMAVTDVAEPFEMSLAAISKHLVILTRAGLTVARNAPFAGAFVTQQYGRPSRRQHAVQLEIDRSLYMDEARIRPRDDFDAFRDLIAAAIAEMTEIGRALPLAAE